ncbi:MAG TPA: YciI family protein [Micromonosporaceae bacterium]|nr:YciI family protein [Micromonosporaceae bacterium]
MDGFEAELIARGPTLAADDDTPTGSLHIVELPNAAAARAFAFDEPNYQAGCTGTCCCGGGATRWDVPCGTFPEARRVATDTLCSAWAEDRPLTSQCPLARTI